LLRVAQEAVTNAVKYGGGEAATITLRYSDDGVELRVENPLANTPLAAHSYDVSGYGLAGMHERLRLIDGELQVGPVEGRWVVRARVSR
jgi:signal transduction histidine kinase